jgi:hypothetical protein
MDVIMIEGLELEMKNYAYEKMVVVGMRIRWQKSFELSSEHQA